jgi:RimJ/RimL family protein N-acetyltransferase
LNVFPDLHTRRLQLRAFRTTDAQTVFDSFAQESVTRYYNRAVEIGYDLHLAFWRQGIMTEALEADVDFTYSDNFFFLLNHIQALTYIDHAASIRLLAKLGFQEAGIRREAGYWKNQFHDLCSFSWIRPGWMNPSNQQIFIGQSQS